MNNAKRREFDDYALLQITPLLFWEAFIKFTAVKIGDHNPC